MSNWEIHDEKDWRILSEDGKAVLTRWCIVHQTNDKPTRTMVAIGINPSGKTLLSSDDDKPDNVSMTAKRLRSFAEKANCDRIILFNIFPDATESVSALAKSIKDLECHEGKGHKTQFDSNCEVNICKINDILNQLSTEGRIERVLLCFGRGIRKHVKLEEFLLKILTETSLSELQWYYLDLTSDKIPRHPNSCKKDSDFTLCDYRTDDNGKLIFEKKQKQGY